MRRWICLLGLMILLPVTAMGETLGQSVEQLLGTLELESLDRAAEECSLLQGNAKEILKELASGRMVLSAQEALSFVLSQAAGIFRKSLWRMTRLLVPLLVVSCAEWIRTEHEASAKTARYAGMMLTMALLVSDLREHVALAGETVDRMAEWMQAIFPVLVTLLAAVGGTASSAFYQPAVIAAGGAMTTLVHQVTMPLAVSVAVLTMVGSLSEELRVSRLCRLFRQAANWTLGFGFTVFIGVMSVQGMSAAALDGVSIRTAKYAIDNFVPIVGGMFSDTVDTLVGCSLVVHNAVGVFGLLLLLGALLVPLLRTMCTLFLYRAAAAVVEPVSNSPLCRTIGGYADVFSLLFIIQLSVGAMFLMLVAQLMTVGNLTVMLR